MASQGPFPQPLWIRYTPDCQGIILGDDAPGGKTIARGKVWERGTQEPEKWTLEVPHKAAHKNGAPGLFGFALQSMFRVYIDNISVKSNG